MKGIILPVRPLHPIVSQQETDMFEAAASNICKLSGGVLAEQCCGNVKKDILKHIK